MQNTEHTTKKATEISNSKARDRLVDRTRRATGVPRRDDRQLEMPLKPWQGARYDVPFQSGEVAILPHRSTEATGTRPPPVQPSAEPDAPPAAPQAVALVEDRWGDDVREKVAPKPDEVTETAAPAPAPAQPLAALAQRFGSGRDNDNAAGHPWAD